MSVEEIEDAMMVIADFLQVDEDAQQEALEVAVKCMDAVLRLLENGND